MRREMEQKKMRMSETALREYAEGLEISLDEARAQIEAMEAETEAYAKEHGMSFEDAEDELARKEARESGLLFAAAELVEKNADLFEDETVEAARKLKNTKN